MTTAVSFSQAILADFGAAQTVEEAFRVYGNWACIHDFNFDSIYEAASVSVGAATGWATPVKAGTALPVDVLVEYNVTSGSHALLLRHSEYDDSGLLFGINSSGHLFAQEWAFGNPGIMYMNIPAHTTIGNVKIAYRQQRFSSDENDVWEAATMWIDDALIDTYVRYVGTATGESVTIAFTSDTTGQTFTDVRVPQLTQFTEWTSIDPGEPAAGGLERAVEGRYTKYFMRFNGELRAWRSKASPSRHTFTDSDSIYVRAASYDRRQLYTHVRMLGAWVQAEAVRGDLIKSRRHRFLEANNPFLMSEADCYAEATNELRRMEEAAYTETIETPFTPLLEPEDRISTPSGEWIVSSREADFSITASDQALTTRKYAYTESV
jgi:hypothetical protein